MLRFIFPIIISINPGIDGIKNFDANNLKWQRPDGSIISINKSSIEINTNKEMNNKQVKWTYTKQNDEESIPIIWNVEANCSTNKVDWDKDETGLIDIKNIDNFKNSQEILDNCPNKKAYLWYEAAKEAKFILENFCK